MAISVDVAKDPKAIRQKFIGNFTRRQFFSFGAAALVGVPFYFIARKNFGTDISALMMVGVMLPFFFIGLYEKDGVPAEKYLMQIIEMKFVRPGIRKYRAENLYDQLREREKVKKEVEILEGKRTNWKKERSDRKKERKEKRFGKKQKNDVGI